MAAALLVAAAAAAAEDRRALLELVVNGVRHGTAEVVLRDEDALLEVGALERAGLGGLGGQRQTIGAVAFVSLSSLRPRLTFSLDEPSLELRISAQPALLGRTVLDLRPGPPAGMEQAQDPSAFLNYALTARDAAHPVSAFTEIGLSHQRRLLHATLSAGENRGLVRGVTRVLVDEPHKRRRFVAGDHLASTRSTLGGGLLLAGVGVFREFSLDPYFVRHGAPELSGTLLVPSTVEAYVNGVLVKRQDLPPGEFALRNLPAATGSGDTRVVIRDAFGNERELVSPFYMAAGTLARGISEYGYHLGFRRERLNLESFAYGKLAFVGAHRYGMSDTLTLGGRLEGGPGLLSGGPSLAVRLPKGELEVQAGFSRDRGEGGMAGQLAYRYTGGRASAAAFVGGASRRYAHTALPGSEDRPLFDSGLFFGFPAGPVSLTLQLAHQRLRDKGERTSTTLNAILPIGRRASLFVSGVREQPQTGAGDRVAAGLTWFLGGRMAAKAAGEAGRQGRSGFLELQKSLPVGSGWGYRLKAGAADGRHDSTVHLQYQGPHGRYELLRQESAGIAATTASAAGGLVLIGGGLRATRPVQESFALIRVGVPGVRGYLSNQVVGRTDARGDLFVPQMIPYFGNRLSIADEDVPLEYVVDDEEKVVAVPALGGAVVRFPVWQRHALLGRLVVVSGGRRLAPERGTLSVRAGEARFTSPLGHDGAFYLEAVPPGAHAAVAEYDGGTCAFTLEVPQPKAALLSDLGELDCVPAEEPR